LRKIRQLFEGPPVNATDNGQIDHSTDDANLDEDDYDVDLEEVEQTPLDETEAPEDAGERMQRRILRG
jgi:hypothetical protein